MGPPNTSISHNAFPHNYIRDNGYRLSASEEQTLCTVYSKTPVENQEILKQSLISYIDWRCRTSENDQLPVDPSASSCSLHLCTHLDRTNQRVDKGTLSEFSNILENDGITRLDLLWNMKPYSKWFDATPGILISDAVA